MSQKLKVKYRPNINSNCNISRRKLNCPCCKHSSLAAVLSAMAPELAPFMADELLLSMPEVEGIDYTMKEYMKLVDQTKQCVERLNAQGEDPRHIRRYHSKNTFAPHLCMLTAGNILRVQRDLGNDIYLLY